MVPQQKLIIIIMYIYFSDFQTGLHITILMELCHCVVKYRTDGRVQGGAVTVHGGAVRVHGGAVTDRETWLWTVGGPFWTLKLSPGLVGH